MWGFSYAARRCRSSVFSRWSLVFSSVSRWQSWQVMLLFLADYEVDSFSDVFLGAVYLGAVAEGGDSFLYEPQYLIFLELEFAFF